MLVSLFSQADTREVGYMQSDSSRRHVVSVSSGWRLRVLAGNCRLLHPAASLLN